MNRQRIDIMEAIETLLSKDAEAREAAEKFLDETIGAEKRAKVQKAVMAGEADAVADEFGVPECKDSTGKFREAIRSGATGSGSAMWLYRRDDERLRAKGSEAMVKKMRNFVHSCANNWYPTYMPSYGEDFIQSGCLGVVAAMANYSEEHSFLTWCVRYIKHEMFCQASYVSNASSIYYGQQIASATKAMSRIKVTGRDVTAEEVAKEMNQSVTAAKIAMDAVKKSSMARLDAPGEDGIPMVESVSDDGKSVEDLAELSFEMDRVSDWMKTLEQEERTVIAMKFWDDMTFPQIGEAIGLVGERSEVEAGSKRIYRCGMNKLRKLAAS